jgi:hypothetical protein
LVCLFNQLPEKETEKEFTAPYRGEMDTFVLYSLTTNQCLGTAIKIHGTYCGVLVIHVVVHTKELCRQLSGQFLQKVFQ